MARGIGLAKQRVSGSALLLRLVPYRDADAIVHLFSEEHGALAAMARGARRSRRRFQSLEPMHGLRVSLDLAAGRELGTLIETTLERPRLHLTASLEAMEAAGQALRWVRRAAPPAIPEPGLWLELTGLLDALDEPGAGARAREALAASGLRMLAAAGWGLELSSCVRCGKVCPARARTAIDVRAGGVVCRDCGATGRAVSSRTRQAMVEAAEGGPFEGVDPGPVIELVELAFEAHGRGDAT
ncbi:MAG: DNA repair protein RecO [Myxococcales bacterium]|nr:DNA repair protein RecO [Myxococcales bacterium]